MEENQVYTSQVTREDSNIPPEIIKKAQEKKSKLPMISVILSAITLFITIVILVIVIMSSFMNPLRGGGMVIGERPQNLEFPQGGNIPFEQQEGGNGNTSGNRIG